MHTKTNFHTLNNCRAKLSFGFLSKHFRTSHKSDASPAWQGLTTADNARRTSVWTAIAPLRAPTVAAHYSRPSCWHSPRISAHKTTANGTDQANTPNNYGKQIAPSHWSLANKRRVMLLLALAWGLRSVDLDAHVSGTNRGDLQDY